MTVTDNPAPKVFDAFEPDTTHLPMIGDMNYYEFINQFSDYMQDGDVIPDSVWNDFKLSAFGAGEPDCMPDELLKNADHDDPEDDDPKDDDPDDDDPKDDDPEDDDPKDDDPEDDDPKDDDDPVDDMLEDA